MKAVGFYKYLPVIDPESFLDLELPKPQAKGRDLLVRVHAVSVNPVDIKQRAPRNQVEKEPRILGWDVAGIVEQAGDQATMFRPGDEVYYAGSLQRQGCNSEYHLVDERIAGHRPRSLSFEEAAAMPLTSITAWESLFDRLGIVPEQTEANRNAVVLIIGGAGGVGSIATQLAKKISGLHTIATASRKESSDWCKELGADSVITHRLPLKDELQRIGISTVDYILCCNSVEQYISQFADIIKPQGKICTIVRAKDDQPLQINPLMYKSVAFVWELMFTRPMFETPDMVRQHELLDAVAALLDRGVLRTTRKEDFGSLNAENLRKAHARIESGEMIGKLTLTVDH